MSAAAETTMPAFHAARAMGLLWERASPNLTPREVRWFADYAADQVVVDSRLLAVILEGVSCLVAADGEGRGSGTGSFQGQQEVADMLLFASNQARTLQGLAQIASSAADDAFRQLEQQNLRQREA